jgi:hypothetical protein
MPSQRSEHDSAQDRRHDCSQSRIGPAQQGFSVWEAAVPHVGRTARLTTMAGAPDKAVGGIA